MSSPPLKVIELDFATLELFDNYIISTINEGVAFDLPHLEKFSEIFNTHYAGKPYVSIANRRYDYTINPTCLLQADLFSNLLGIGVVYYTQSALETVHFEKNFYKGTLEAFSSLEECLSWTQNLLEVHKNKNAGL